MENIILSIKCQISDWVFGKEGVYQKLVFQTRREAGLEKEWFKKIDNTKKLQNVNICLTNVIYNPYNLIKEG